MKILITGAGGQLAKAFEQQNKKDTLILATKSLIDIENRQDVYKKVRQFNPDIVFHFASMTRGDECAANPERAYKINVTGTRHIARITAKLKIPILFVSTNEVFDGKTAKPYTENDAPHPKTVVGKNKLLAEEIIRRTNSHHYIIRTMWLYSKWSDNFIHAIVRKANQNKSVKLVSDEIGAPTNAIDLAKVISKLIRTKKYGIYHLVNTGEASRLDFGKEVFKRLNLKVNVTAVKLGEYKRISQPPLYSVLLNTKAKKIGISLRNWKSALADFLSTEKQ